MRSGARAKWENMNDWIEREIRAHTVRKKAKHRYKRMNGGVNCKDVYKTQVLPYWKRYGLKPKLFWYRLHAVSETLVDPRYIPDDLFVSKIVPYFSNTQFRRFGEDKCLHGVWFPDVKRPHTVCANVAGIFYDENYRIITREEAAERCAAYGRFLIKPSIDSGEGRLIRFYDDKELTPEYMLGEFERFGCNFLAQEAIRQHPTLAKLNESSLNTVRIVTLLFEGETHVLSSILRIGGSGSRVDNVGAGGYSCAILEHGQLRDKAVNRKSEWVEKTESGISFREVVIPAYDKAVELVKGLQQRLAHFKIVGWDIGIDENEEPVLIEFNTNPGQNQYSCGPTFGDLTDRVLEDVFIKKSLKDSRN